MKVFNAICNVLLVIVIILALLLIISVLPIPGNYKVLMVLSGSMEPVIKTGSIVAVKPSEDYQINDIITFHSSKSETPVTHRIVDTGESDDTVSYKVKGDANEESDWKEVSKENVIGKVLFSVPLLGYVINFIQQPIGFALIVLVPAIIIIYGEVMKIKREIV